MPDDTETEDDLPASGNEEEHDDENVLLYDGEPLSSEDTTPVTAQTRAEVVVLAGPVASGKTTLITALYESLQEAPFAGASFAGSRTLVAFERRCHDGRAVSGRDTPETARTPITEGAQFLHLRLSRASGDASALRDLLLSDVSGEMFQRLRDLSPEGDEFAFLQRADRLCVVLDGEKLAVPAQRQLPRNDARSLIRSVIEAGAIRSDCHIDIVFAKWDEVERATDDGLERFLTDTRELLARTCKDYKHTFFEVAARPKKPSPPYGHGLATLLRAWIEPKAESPPVISLEKALPGRRAYSLLGRSVEHFLGLGNSHVISWS